MLSGTDTLAQVSILVLVDVSLEVCFAGHLPSPFLSFNPCSRGCFARRVCEVIEIRSGLGFNPCSRGCFARSVVRSLLVVITLRFNPCSRGCFARSNFFG